MSFWEKALKKSGALGKSVVWLLYFICADSAIYYAFMYLNIDRKIYKGTYNLISSIVIFVTMFVIAKLLSLKSEPLIKIKKITWDQILCLIVVGLGMLGFVTLYIIIADKIAAYLESLKNAMQDYRESVDRFSDTPQIVVPAWDTVLYVITLCFIVPVTEELTFRGVVFGQLRREFGPMASIILSAILFGLLHGISVHIGYAIVCGLIIAAVYNITDSLIAPIILHAVFNIFGSGIANFMTFEAFGIPGNLTSTVLLGINITSMLMMPVAVIAFAYLVVIKRKRAKESEALEQASEVQVELSGETEENGIEAKE